MAVSVVGCTLVFILSYSDRKYGFAECLHDVILMLTSSRRGIAKLSLELVDFKCTQRLQNSRLTPLCYHCCRIGRQSSIWHARRPSSSTALAQARGTGSNSRSGRNQPQKGVVLGQEKRQTALYNAEERSAGRFHASELGKRKIPCHFTQDTHDLKTMHVQHQNREMDKEPSEGGECSLRPARKQITRPNQRVLEFRIQEETGAGMVEKKARYSRSRELVNPSRHLSRILADNTNSLEDAWDLYQHYHDQGVNTLNDRVLEKLAHRIIHVRRPTRLFFFRLLSVVSRLRLERQKTANYPLVRTIEWNALIHFAGNGLRVTTPESYNAALEVYDDMLHHLKREDDAQKSQLDPSRVKLAEPDIYTYTTLLNIAVKSKHKPAIEHAANLLKSKQAQPTRVTHLSTLPYRFREEGLLGIRSLLSTLYDEGYGIDIDGINAYITCAGKEGRIDIVQNLYMVLRQNQLDFLQNGNGNDDHDDEHRPSLSASYSHATNTTLADKDNANLIEGVLIPRTLVPDEITYTFVIQALAYSGDILNAINVLTDMLSTKRPEPDNGYYQPSYPIFRAFFLAFSKHAAEMSRLPSGARYRHARRSGWSWERLQILLDSFFELEDCKPSARVVYWIVMSVKWTTGNDEERIRSIWLKLKERFSFRIGGRLRKVDEWFGMTEERWKNRWTKTQP